MSSAVKPSLSMVMNIETGFNLFHSVLWFDILEYLRFDIMQGSISWKNYILRFIEFFFIKYISNL